MPEPVEEPEMGLHPLTHIICESMLLLGFPSQRPRYTGSERVGMRDVYTVLTPSDETLLQLCVYGYIFFVCVSIWRPAKSVYMCVCAYLPTQYPVL